MREKVLKLREQLMKELDGIEPGEVVSLSNYSKEVIDLILFDGIEDDDTRINSIDEYGKRASKKVFALPEEYLEKIDFSNVDFTNFHASSFDFSKLHGVNIDPQSVYANSLIFSKLKNVNFIGSFNNVSIHGADFTGSTNAQITPLLLHADLDYSETLFLKNYDGQFTINLSGCNFRDVTFIPDAFMVDACINANDSTKEANSKSSKELREERKKNERLEKELARKEKALAETAALLVLRKKANAIWGTEDP